MTEAVLEAMSEEQILDFADTCAETARRAEVDLLRAAYQWAVVHSPERLDPATSVLPGRERARRYGGAGTPEVTEFAAAAFGARIGRSTFAAQRLIADALDLRHRHPQLWARVQAGEVRASYARHVTKQTRDLTVDQAGFVDAGVAESADGRITWSRFEALVAAKVAQADPAAAREKEQRAAKAAFAKKTANEAHGMASFLVRADVATINAIDAAVTAYAKYLETVFPDASVDERRVLAVLFLVHGNKLPEPDNEVPDLPAPTAEVWSLLDEGDVGEARLLLHPYLRWQDKSVDIRGREKVLAHLREHPRPRPPREVEVRDGQVYRWVR